MTEREAAADGLIEDWIAERADLGPAPEMSESDAAQVFARIQSRIRTRRVSSMWSAAAAALAVALALGATWLLPPKARRDPPTPIKQVLFETQLRGKVVRFEMRVHKSQQPAEVSHERAR